MKELSMMLWLFCGLFSFCDAAATTTATTPANAAAAKTGCTVTYPIVIDKIDITKQFEHDDRKYDCDQMIRHCSQFDCSKTAMTPEQFPSEIIDTNQITFAKGTKLCGMKLVCVAFECFQDYQSAWTAFALAELSGGHHQFLKMQAVLENESWKYKLTKETPTPFANACPHLKEMCGGKLSNCFLKEPFDNTYDIPLTKAAIEIPEKYQERRGKSEEKCNKIECIGNQDDTKAAAIVRCGTERSLEYVYKNTNQEWSLSSCVQTPNADDCARIQDKVKLYGSKGWDDKKNKPYEKSILDIIHWRDALKKMQEKMKTVLDDTQRDEYKDTFPCIGSNKWTLEILKVKDQEKKKELLSMRGCKNPGKNCKGFLVTPWDILQFITYVEEKTPQQKAGEQQEEKKRQAEAKLADQRNIDNQASGVLGINPFVHASTIVVTAFVAILTIVVSFFFFYPVQMNL